MNKVQQILAYICLNYKYPSELSKARITKLVYLADWFSSVFDGHTMTDTNWVFNHYGPYVDTVIDAAQTRLGFAITHEQTMYGTSKYVLSYNGTKKDINLSTREEQIIDAVMKKTETMFFNDFIDYVYSTYPVQSKERYSNLDLVSLANEYNSLK